MEIWGCLFATNIMLLNNTKTNARAIKARLFSSFAYKRAHGLARLHPYSQVPWILAKSSSENSALSFWAHSCEDLGPCYLKFLMAEKYWPNWSVDTNFLPQMSSDSVHVRCNNRETEATSDILSIREPWLA